MENRESITFLGQEYRSQEPDSDGIDAVYVLGKVKIEAWFWNGSWEAGLDHDDGNVQIANQRSDKVFKTEAAALRDLETNARKFLRALGVQLEMEI